MASKPSYVPGFMGVLRRPDVPLVARPAALRALLGDGQALPRAEVSALLDRAPLTPEELGLLVTADAVGAFSLATKHVLARPELTDAYNEHLRTLPVKPISSYLNSQSSFPDSSLDILEARSEPELLFQLLHSAPGRPDRPLPRAWCERVRASLEPRHLDVLAGRLLEHSTEAALELARACGRARPWVSLAVAADRTAADLSASTVVAEFSALLEAAPADEVARAALDLGKALSPDWQPSGPPRSVVGTLVAELALTLLGVAGRTPGLLGDAVQDLAVTLTNLAQRDCGTDRLPSRDDLLSDPTTALARGWLKDVPCFLPLEHPLVTHALRDLSPTTAVTLVHRGAGADALLADKTLVWRTEMAVHHLNHNLLDPDLSRILADVLLPAFLDLIAEGGVKCRRHVPATFVRTFEYVADPDAFLLGLPAPLLEHLRTSSLEDLGTTLPARVAHILDQRLLDSSAWDIFAALSPGWEGTLGELVAACTTLGYDS